jgi:hypothetical protein
MNRAERRRIERADKPRTINMDENKLNQIIEREMKDMLKKERDLAFEFNTEALLAVTMTALNDMHGFGEIRLNRIKKRIELKFDCIRERHASIEDHIKEAEKLGVYVRVTEKGGAV